MKAFVITTENEIRLEEFKTFMDFGRAVGGLIEIVYPAGLDPYRMLVNEEGLLEGLPVNRRASKLYGAQIVGNAVIAKEGMVDGEPDIVGLNADDIESLLWMLKGDK